MKKLFFAAENWKCDCVNWVRGIFYGHCPICADEAGRSADWNSNCSVNHAAIRDKAIKNGTMLKRRTPPNFTQRNRVKLKFDVDISVLLVILGNLITGNKGSSASQAFIFQPLLACETWRQCWLNLWQIPTLNTKDVAISWNLLALTRGNYAAERKCSSRPIKTLQHFEQEQTLRPFPCRRKTMMTSSFAECKITQLCHKKFIFHWLCQS